MKHKRYFAILLVTLVCLAANMKVGRLVPGGMSGILEGMITFKTIFGTINLSGGLIAAVDPGEPAKIRLRDGSIVLGSIVSGEIPVRWQSGMQALEMKKTTQSDSVLSVSGDTVGPPSVMAGAAIPSKERKPGSVETIGGVTFIAIPGGEFLMGDNSERGGPDEKPVHEVRLSPFLMSKYEVTVGEFRTFILATGYRTEAEKDDGAYILFRDRWLKRANASWERPNFDQSEYHPVTCVSWNDAIAYCGWFEMEYNVEVRLPTEAEWEYAARGGVEGRRYPGGDVIFPNMAQYTDSHLSGTAQVGSYPGNGYGLHDMAGNVWEWCMDWYDWKHYESSLLVNPVGPYSGADRVLRGGSWDNSAAGLRVANRDNGGLTFRCSILGFRLVHPATRS